MEENNKLIAEFMGVDSQILSTNNVHSWSDAPFYYITEDSKEKVMEGVSKYSKYHTSWDWLMPVVEKIECTPIDNDDNSDNFFNVMIEVFECNINGGDICICENGHTKREATYNAVLEFIKQYNDEQNKA